ncbi:MAG: neutral zinc metallopeptidase [Thermomicrobiales bacterium]
MAEIRGDLGGLTGGSESQPAASSEPISSIDEECQSGADANEQQDCRIVGYVNSIQAFWTDAYAVQGATYTESQTVIFSDPNSRQVWRRPFPGRDPFYVRPDQKVYLDLGFFDDLRTKFGAQEGDRRNTCWRTNTDITFRISRARSTWQTATIRAGKQHTSDRASG